MYEVCNEGGEQLTLEDMGKEQQPTGASEQTGLPEAPASANTRIRTEKNFVWQVTLRADDGQKLAKKIEGFEKFCEEKVWKPETGYFDKNRPLKEGEAQAVVQTETKEEEHLCPMHGVRMFKKTGKHGEFWTHGQKKADGTWENCTGRGFK